MRAILSIFLIINLVAFIVVGIDKYKAQRSLWRIPEKEFFWFALIGGCPGVYSGLMLFRHKTRHWYFIYGIPFIFLIQIVVIYLALNI